MADFTALKTAIQTYIKQNGNEEINGEKLQEILLSMVTTLGDSAINDLVTALTNEVAARQNADGTLQQNITSEATARGNADTALGGRIDDEETARANGDTALSNRLGSSITSENTAADQIGAEAEARAAADTALQDLIDGITDNIENGYVYAGIATPSSTPATGKVFYLALTAGTYTNFGSTVVSQGINILKYNGSAWSLDAFIGIDDELTPGSNNLPKSGNVLENIIKNGSAFDLSAYNAVDGVPATYADLDAALAALKLLPAVYKQPGMSFRFVSTSYNKYVQFRLTKDEWSTNVSDWIEVDSNKVEDKTFYITDSDGNIIAKIDKNGVHSVDFKYGPTGISVSDSISGIPSLIITAVNAEKLLREQAVAAEESRAKTEENKKLNFNISDNAFYFTDSNGYIIAKIDADGVHSVNIDEQPNVIDNDELVLTDSQGYIIAKIDKDGFHTTNNVLKGDELAFTDKNGYIIAKIDSDGIHAVQNKHSVACMVLGENYYPTETPTRDSQGNVVNAKVMFATGVSGEIDVEYTNGVSTSVDVTYGNYEYSITINRDNNDNVTTVTVE